MTAAYESDTSRHNAVTQALLHQQNFDRGQVAWLMSMASRWGYEAGYEDGYENGQRDELALASISAAYADTRPFSAEVTEHGLKKRGRRQESDAAARLARPNDFQGIGPLADEDDGGLRVAA